MVVAGVLVGIADASVHAEPPDDLEDDVFRVDALRQRSRHLDPPDLERLEGQALRGQDVPHLRRADAERDCAKRPVCRRVAVAARDRHAGLRNPELGSDDVHDTLRPAVEVEQRHARLAAVALESREHVFGHDVHERPPLIARRHDVIDRRDGATGIPNLPPSRPQHVKRLRARDFVDEMQPDKQLRLSIRQRPDGMGVPDFLQQGLRHCLLMVHQGRGSRLASRGSGGAAGGTRLAARSLPASYRLDVRSTTCRHLSQSTAYFGSPSCCRNSRGHDASGSLLS